jgi:hypothetical protein
MKCEVCNMLCFAKFYFTTNCIFLDFRIKKLIEFYRNIKFGWAFLF